MEFGWPPPTFASALLAAAAFGVLGILMMLLGYKVFDWTWGRIDVQRELAERNNIAVAIVIGAVIIAVAIVMSAAMS